jgi:hypothetical protein
VCMRRSRLGSIRWPSSPGGPPRDPPRRLPRATRAREGHDILLDLPSVKFGTPQLHHLDARSYGASRLRVSVFGAGGCAGVAHGGSRNCACRLVQPVDLRFVRSGHQPAMYRLLGIAKTYLCLSAFDAQNPMSCLAPVADVCLVSSNSGQGAGGLLGPALFDHVLATLRELRRTAEPRVGRIVTGGIERPPGRSPPSRPGRTP